MRVLSMDPGAERMGWAVISEDDESKDLTDLGSGFFGLPREDKSYQPYRLELITACVHRASDLLAAYDPDVVVSEIVPPSGGRLANLIQRQLALTAITVFQVTAAQRGCEVAEIAASTVKKRIGGAGKASKVRVRNGVVELMPELTSLHPGLITGQWTEIFEEPDAYAVGLTFLGRSV